METLLEEAWVQRQPRPLVEAAVPYVEMTPRAQAPAPQIPVSVNEKIAPEQVHLMHIAYSEETFQRVSAGMIVLDNRTNARPDWQEYWPIRQFLLNTPLDERAYYGFFSPRFKEKTGLDGDYVRQFVANLTTDHDIVTFSPQPDFGACFLNVFEQNDFLDPGFRDISQAFSIPVS